MKDKSVFTIGLLFLCLCLNLIPFSANAQEKYLIVLDVQKFPKKNKQLERSVREMIENVNSLVSHFNSESVIYIKATGRALSITFKGLSVDTLPAADFDSTLRVVNNNIFTKTEGDAFTSLGLKSFLENKNAKEIVLVGLMAEKCIYDTALGGKSRGYDIRIVPEGIVGMTPKKKEKAINKMQVQGIRFIPITEIINAP